jgi:lipopolysaccharide/colanic/teichoic acid biosynthesis glycosyltransferase
LIAKRLFDLVFAGLGLLFLAPLFLLIALMIKLDTAGPVFFRQERVGRFGIHFRIHKFRTMAVNTEAKGLQLTTGNDSRITRTGQWLRKYKLDELAQLIDVVLGKMSLVGPRPEVPRYVAMYPEAARKIILSVRPGITDLASIEFKDENEILTVSEDPERDYIEKILPKKIHLYQKYVSERSLWFDLALIFKTIRAIV